MSKELEEAQKIYDLKLHEECCLSMGTSIVRVPGGWIYRIYGSPDTGDVTAVFVPFDNEFQPKPPEKGIPR